jgi:tetratricopeptide (TPR) repeat protein
MSAALLAAVALFARQPDGSSSLDANRIVVVPFRTSGSDSAVAYLAEGVVDLLAPMLAGDGGPVAVDSRTAISTWNRITRGREGTADDARRVARELGAGLALTGAIVDVGGTLTIAGTIITADRGGDRSLTSVSAPRDSVNALLDRFVGQLLARQSGVPEPSLAAVTSQSLPAIRAYLAGRAAYRRADEDLAIERFTRALDIDSTFALAALDLAVATGKLLRARLCADDTCRVFSIVPGLVLLSERVDDQFDRAVRLAWDSRSRLGRRDRPLLDAYRGANFPRESSARETMTNLRRAVGAAPDRPEAHYLLGVFLLYQGPALGYSDSPEQAEAAFHTASRLDSSYLAPLARLVDVAALERDTAKLQRAGAVYLARDSAGPMADYVRWLVAVGTGDAAAHQEIRARLRSLNRTTLQQIYLTSQMTGLALDDADTSAELLIDATADALDRSVALRRAQLLALNRGRPARAAEYLRRVREAGRSDFQYRNFAILAALFDDGDRAIADSSVRRAAIVLARDTLGPMSADMAGEVEQAMVSQAMWDIEHGDTARLRAAIDWLRRHGAEQPRSRGLIALPEMLVASRDGRPDGARLRAFVDSIALGGCCELSAYGSLALARAYEASGDTAAALRVVRRGIWLFPPRALTAHLREEGRLAARLGDRPGAIRAYEHYLALRSDPEPGLRAARDSVRAEVKRLQRH